MVTVSEPASQAQQRSPPLARSPLRTAPGYYGWQGSNWGNTYAAQTDPNFGQPHYAIRAYHGNAPYYGYTGWTDYSGRNFLRCQPGTMTKLDDGQMYRCQ